MFTDPACRWITRDYALGYVRFLRIESPRRPNLSDRPNRAQGLQHGRTIPFPKSSLIGRGQGSNRS